MTEKLEVENKKLEEQKAAVASMRNATANTKLLISRVDTLEAAFDAQSRLLRETLNLVSEYTYRNPKHHEKDNGRPAREAIIARHDAIKRDAGL